MDSKQKEENQVHSVDRRSSLFELQFMQKFYEAEVPLAGESFCLDDFWDDDFDYNDEKVFHQSGEKELVSSTNPLAPSKQDEIF